MIIAFCLLLPILCGCLPENTSAPPVAEAAEAAPAPAEPEEPAAAPQEELPPADPRPAEVRMLTSTPANLDPADISRGGKTCLLEIYEPLFVIDPDTRALTPVLADAAQGENGVEHAAGTGVYTVNLLPGLADHQGNPVTAEDAAFCCTRTAEALGWSDFKSAVAESETRLTLTFAKELSAPGRRAEVLSAFYLYSKAAFEAADSFAASACGTGPYMLSACSAGESLTVQAWDGYRLPPENRAARAAANVLSVTYVFEDSPAEQVMQLEVGKAQMCDELSFADTVDFRQGGVYADLFQTVLTPSEDNLVIFPNQAYESVMKEEDLRKGLFYAINTTALADYQGEGGAVPCFAVANPTAPDLPASFAEKENYQTQTLEVDAVRTYLRRANYVNEAFVLLVEEDTAAEELAVLIQTALRPWSITANVVAVSLEEFNERLGNPKAWNLAILTLKADTAAGLWKQLWTDTAVGSTVRGSLKDTRFNAYLDAVSTEAGCTEENMTVAGEYMLEHAYAMSLVQDYRCAVVPAGVSSVCLTARGELLPGACVFGG